MTNYKLRSEEEIRDLARTFAKKVERVDASHYPLTDDDQYEGGIYDALLWCLGEPIVEVMRHAGKIDRNEF